uniref:Portal protein n=1 Tax=Siphoviridae sp. ctXWf36 TaxID=2825544 RepID=A0A8S5U2S3_9CAUD|nr:MAG TPA: portal protein [Siphoviridae sp. ctXWf36]
MPENNLSSRLKNAWNAFMNRDPPVSSYVTYGGSSYNPYRTRLNRGNEKSFIAPIFTKIAMDCASISLLHVRIDSEGNYVETIDSKLNQCLTLSANKDQTPRDFIMDAVLSMFDEGTVALPPIDTVTKKTSSGLKYDIGSIRTAQIIQWYPDYVKMRAYNDRTGQREDLTMPKSSVPIVTNPLYSVMNENNSVVQRLIRTLNLSDTIDAQNGSGKLDMIIQLPYQIRTKSMEERAQMRRDSISDQLENSKYGIAYIDGTEHVTQLNRGVENNLYERVKYLVDQLYSQLGLTTEILNGTASDATMQNYYTRLIEPIVSAITDSMRWKYLTQKARDDGETIMYFRDPFKLLSPSSVADTSDKLTRNEILSPNEVRQMIGRKPVKNEKANELRNRNISAPDNQEFANAKDEEPTATENTQEKE